MSHAIYFISYASFATIGAIIIAWGQYVRYKKEGTPFNFTLLLLLVAVALAMWTGAGLTIFAYEPSNKTAGLAAFFGGLSLSALMAWLVNKTVKKIQNDGKLIEELTSTDSLTDMLNRRVFHEVLMREFVRSIEFEMSFAVVTYDIDFLTKINDTHGFKSGDLVLREVGKRSKGALYRSVDTAYRLKADKFALVLPRATLEEAKDIAKKAHAALTEKPYDLGNGQSVQVTFSMGMAAFTEPIDSEQVLFENARKAHDVARDGGGNALYLFEKEGVCEKLCP